MLPAHVDAVLAAERSRDADPLLGRPLDGIRVLIVDDDADARELVGELLSIAGADVTAAASAHEAFALLQANPPTCSSATSACRTRTATR